MTEISTIGIDLAKHVFQIDGLSDDDCSAQTVSKRGFAAILLYFSNLWPCLSGIEACGSAHDWARELTRQGHTVKQMPAAYVKR